jgi:2'-5' RNA ligase
VLTSGPQSGLIVEIPDAEPVVGRHRERLDSSARLGVPAHITVLFPFMEPSEIDDAVQARLQDLFAAADAFDFVLDRTDWFDDEVLWLAPRDPGPFSALTQLVVGVFPEYPPYGGEFDAIMPHLTIGDGHPAGEMRTAEKHVREGLPIEGHAAAVTLITRQSAGERWRVTSTFPLGGLARPG